MMNQAKPALKGVLGTVSVLAAAAVMTASAALAQDLPVNVPVGKNDAFQGRVLTTGLSNPWEMTAGPDGKLWVTERSTGEVTKVDMFTGEQQTILTLTDFSVDVQHQGLLGMALHPELLKGTGNDYVYLVYTHNNGEAPNVNPKARLVRYSYDAVTETLTNPEILIDGIPAGNDHNAGRVKFSPDGKNIFYTLGEQGANFGGNYQKPNAAQRTPTAEEIEKKDYVAYGGKVLRLNLDGSIPEDNPVIDGVKSHIYTYGHRNPQGIDFGKDGTIYISEHGPDSDDELNILVPGGNYGWPNVAGFKDDQAYVFADWSKSEPGQRYTGRAGFPDNIPQFKESEFTKDMVDPIKTFFTVGDDFDFTANCGWICNPTIGPSSLMYYEAGENGIKEFNNSLLVPALKHGIVYVQHLSEDGQTVQGEPEAWFSTQNRYRDIEITADNRVFLATDNFGTASQKYGDTGFTNVLQNPGAIIVYDYVGEGEGGKYPHAPVGQALTDIRAAAVTADGGDVKEAAADFDTLYKAGETLFGTTCAACHGAEGEGAQGPGFQGRDDIMNDKEYLATTLLKGFGYMPAFEKRLDDAKIAAILTYVANSWDNEGGVVTPADVAAKR